VGSQKVADVAKNAIESTRDQHNSMARPMRLIDQVLSKRKEVGPQHFVEHFFTEHLSTIFAHTPIGTVEKFIEGPPVSHFRKDHRWRLEECVGQVLQGLHRGPLIAKIVERWMDQVRLDQSPINIKIAGGHSLTLLAFSAPGRRLGDQAGSKPPPYRASSRLALVPDLACANETARFSLRWRALQLAL